MKNINMKFNFEFDPLFFGISKWIGRVMALLILLASISFLFAILDTFFTDGLSVPHYGVEDGYRDRYKKGWHSWAEEIIPEKMVPSGYSSDERSKENVAFGQFNAKHGGDIEKIIEKYNFKAAATAENIEMLIRSKYIDDHTKQMIIQTKNVNYHYTYKMLNLLQEVPEKWRKSFISGWDNYLKDGLGKLEAKSEKNALSPFQITNEYNDRFQRALVKLRRHDLILEFARYSYLTLLFSSMMMFVFVTILLVLIANERNTRSLRSGAARENLLPAASPAEAVAALQKPAAPAEALCPQCQASIALDDVFCENCGYQVG